MKYLLAALLLLTTLSFKSDAQTREETIQWIGEKMALNGSLTYSSGGSIYTYTTAQSIDVNNGDITIINKNKIERFNAEDELSEIRYIFSLSNITGRTNTISSDGVGVVEVFVKDGTVINNDGRGKASKIIIFLHWDAEENLKGRFIRAIDNLARFNKASMPRETY